MKNMSHAGADNLEALSHTSLSRSKRRRLKVEIIGAAIALVCIAIGLIYQWLFPNAVMIPPLFYTIGFLVEGVPVLVTAVKGIFSKDFTNAMEMLVSIAIIACYLSGDLILSVLIPLILNGQIGSIWFIWSFRWDI